MEILCKIRDIYRNIYEYEIRLEKECGVSLNEGMMLCSLRKEKELSSSQLAEKLGLTYSNASKVIKSIEQKGLITRVVGVEDKRQMYFSITKKGENILDNIKCGNIEIPEVLKKIVTHI